MIFILQERKVNRGEMLNKYIEIFKYSLKSKMAFIFDYIISLFSYVIHVFIFNELWDYILQGKEVMGYTKQELIWYIIIAEFVMYTSYKSYKKISQQVKNGEIVNMLIKPISFITYTIFDELSIIIKASINLITGIIMGIFIAGQIEVAIASIALTIISLLLSVFMNILIQLFLGVISFYTEENQSFYLILQKIMFFAVFIPVEFYPSIVQKILFCIPMIYAIYAPSKIFVNFEMTSSLILFAKQIIATLVLFGVIIIMYKGGVKKINVNGG